MVDEKRVAEPAKPAVNASLAEVTEQVTFPAIGARAASGKTPGPAAVNYSHEAMADAILQNPWIAQWELARIFGYTESWVSLVLSSDAFQAYIAKRREEVIDPQVRATIEERMKGVLLQSLNVLAKKLEGPAASGDLALEVMKGASKALGYGIAQPAQTNIQFVVEVPGKATSPEDWAKRHEGTGSTPLGGAPIGYRKPKVIDGVATQVVGEVVNELEKT